MSPLLQALSSISAASAASHSRSRTSAPALDLRGFAAPVHPLDPALCSAIIGEYSRAYLTIFLDRHRRRLAGTSRHLVPILEERASANMSFGVAWDPAFADIRRAALWPRRFSPLKATHAAAAAALRILADGHSARFEAALDPSTRLRLDRWVFPESERVEATGHGRAIELGFGTARRRKIVRLEHRRGRWTASAGDELPAVQIDRELCVLLAPPFWPEAYRGSTVYYAPAIAEKQIVRLTRTAVGVLRGHAPRYLPWVDRVLRAIIPCAGSKSRLRSGSDFDLPGIVQISYPAPPAALAEMMVHECSHLSFQIVTRLGDVDDGSDRTLYYSPVKQMGRPIDRILLAYHAFANLVLFYRMCQASGLDDGGYCERNERATIPQLDVLEEALTKTTALTDIGRTLFEPLRDLIR